MARLLKIRNPIEQVREISFLDETASAGAVNLVVGNNNGVSAGKYLVAEEVGTENAELRLVSNTSGADTIVLSTSVSFDHPAGTVLYVIPFNQVAIEYRVSPSAAWQTLVTIDLDVDQLETLYNHATGEDEYEYRIRWYNQNDNIYSDYSPILKATGFTSRTVSPVISSVLRRIGDRQGRYISRDEVFEEVLYVHDEMVDNLISGSHEYYRKPIYVPTKNWKHEYDMPDDFREIYKVYDAQGNEVDRVSPGRTGKPVYDITGLQKVFFSHVPSPNPDSEEDSAPTTILSLDTADEGGGWTETDDAIDAETDSSEYQVGAGSVKFDVDVSADADNKAGIENDGFTAVDLSDYEDTGKIRVWVYIPNVTYVTGVKLTWGSSSSAHWAMTSTQTYEREGLTDGWNWVEFDWSNSDDITETSTPSASAVDYAKVELIYSAAQADMEGVRVDEISVANTWAPDRLYKVVYLYQPPKIESEMDELHIPPGQSYVLLEKVSGNIMQGMEGKQTAGTRMTERADAKLSRFASRNVNRSKQPRSMRPYGRRRMYGSGQSRIDNSSPHHRDYWDR